MIQGLIKRAQTFHNRLRSKRSVNINDHNTKTAAIELATTYFESYRPALVGSLGETDIINKHDNRWQDLIRLAHSNNKRLTYLKVLSTLLRELKELSVASLSTSAGRSAGGRGLLDITPAEGQIIDTLEALLPTAAASYRQGILDLGERDRLSYRGTAAEFREALREVLGHLAPEADVIKQSGFKYEAGHQRPTMKQKVRYVMTSRGGSRTQRNVTEQSVNGVEEVTGSVFRATYDRASLATHLETTRREVTQIKRYVDTVLFDLLEIPD